MTKHHFIWAVALVLSIFSISYFVDKSTRENSRQEAFMMKACIDAGGQWMRDGWSAYFNCIRPGK